MKKKNLFLILMIFSIFFAGMNVQAKGINLEILETCAGYFGDVNDPNSLMHLIVQIFRIMQWSVPVIFIIMTMMDFAKVVLTDAKDSMDKAKKNFIKRGIIAVAIFLVPVFLRILLQFVDDRAIEACLGHLK